MGHLGPQPQMPWYRQAPEEQQGLPSASTHTLQHFGVQQQPLPSYAPAMSVLVRGCARRGRRGGLAGYGPGLGADGGAHHDPPPFGWSKQRRKRDQNGFVTRLND